MNPEMEPSCAAKAGDTAIAPPPAFWILGYEHGKRRRQSSRQRAVLPHHPLLQRMSQQLGGLEELCRPSPAAIFGPYVAGLCLAAPATCEPAHFSVQSQIATAYLRSAFEGGLAALTVLQFFPVSSPRSVGTWQVPQVSGSNPGLQTVACSVSSFVGLPATDMSGIILVQEDVNGTKEVPAIRVLEGWHAIEARRPCEVRMLLVVEHLIHMIRAGLWNAILAPTKENLLPHGSLFPQWSGRFPPPVGHPEAHHKSDQDYPGFMVTMDFIHRILSERSKDGNFEARQAMLWLSAR